MDTNESSIIQPRITAPPGFSIITGPNEEEVMVPTFMLSDTIFALESANLRKKTTLNIDEFASGVSNVLSDKIPKIIEITGSRGLITIIRFRA
jgi:hypothetical protein